MFTGIITEIGIIHRLIDANQGHLQLWISTKRKCEEIAIGASIACNGVCLTVEKLESFGEGALFCVTASPETLSCTTLKQWQLKDGINLEPALKVGDELGGHFVFGHVDATISLLLRQATGESTLMRFMIPDDLKHLVVKKGSVCLNGVSLTVNQVGKENDHAYFEVMLIPHTLANTTLSRLKKGDLLNFEADMLARYIQNHHVN